MDDPKQPSSPARIEEALHPQIGNGAGFVNTFHESQLRAVDPLKSLDQKILDEDQVVEITEQWQAALDGNTERGITEIADEEMKEEEALEVQQEIPSKEPKKSVKPEPSAVVEPKKEKLKVGKRVKKVARNEADKVAKADKDIRSRYASTRDEQLTPFTRWLKGLKGSEYVHPYDDDFAFLQAEGPAREGISETYADLLAAQGYKDQAIDMYRRLMERFPEKNRFFAAKIEALQ